MYILPESLLMNTCTTLMQHAVITIIIKIRNNVDAPKIISFNDQFRFSSVKSHWFVFLVVFLKIKSIANIIFNFFGLHSYLLLICVLGNFFFNLISF